MGSRRKATRTAAPQRPATKWTSFTRVTTLRAPGAAPAPVPCGVAVFRNARYLVTVRGLAPAAPFGRGVHLSIKRHDRRPVHDWRHLQRIKNEILGPEVEAVELYPAEARKVDGANQYHLWAFPGYRFPFGQQFREVCTPEENAADPDPAVRGAVQRPFAPDDPWNASTGPVSARRGRDGPAGVTEPNTAPNPAPAGAGDQTSGYHSFPETTS